MGKMAHPLCSLRSGAKEGAAAGLPFIYNDALFVEGVRALKQSRARRLLVLDQATDAPLALLSYVLFLLSSSHSPPLLGLCQVPHPWPTLSGNRAWCRGRYATSSTSPPTYVPLRLGSLVFLSPSHRLVAISRLGLHLLQLMAKTVSQLECGSRVVTVKRDGT